MSRELVEFLRRFASQIDGEDFVPDAVDAARIDAAAAALEASAPGGRAWLIETAGPLWFAGTFRREGRARLADFVKDANAAVRYPSRAAAEYAFEALLDMRPRSILGVSCYKITEHLWMPLPAAPKEPTDG